MLLHKAHEEADSRKRYHKGYDTARKENGRLGAGERVALEEVLHQAQARGAHHNGDGQVERELRHNGARAPQDEAADDGGAGARGARHNGEHLEEADAQGRLPVEVVNVLDAGVRVCHLRDCELLLRL